jgi:uncharacterized membrane protein SpoIIM required for sporulation
VDYASFVRRRAPLWDDFERKLEIVRRAPRRLGYGGLEELAVQYRQVLHDHALASARHRGTGAARRLAALALHGTHALQWDRGTRVRGLGHFLSVAFPRAFRRQAPMTLLCCALFVVAGLFGWSLVLAQPATGAAILGPAAEEGMRRGELWTESLTSAIPAVLSSSAIATNNMTVALTGWAGGALFGLGALHVVLFNGFHLGAVFAATSHHGLAGKLLEFVLAHGPLELTLILVTAAAGLRMGHALVAAEDRPRSSVVAEAASDALIVLGGCLPWFVLLGLVEGFVSPVAGLALPLKAALGAALWLGFLLFAVNPALPGERA